MKKLIIGNWKMNLRRADVLQHISAIRALLGGDVESAEVVVCPPSIHLESSERALRRGTIKLGGQNISAEQEGAHTGELSAAMLRDYGCQYVIVGHSERRVQQHEDNELIARKVANAINHGLRVVLCVGESLDERDKGISEAIVSEQLNAALNECPQSDVVVAYEPVWAIGTGRTASAEIAASMHRLIRGELNRIAKGWGDKTPVLYGGSVTPLNAEALLREADINGALVGGASLNAEAFSQIVIYAAEAGSNAPV